MSDRTCSIEGCAKPVIGRGWCSAHYYRWKRNGDPLGGRPPSGGVARFLAAALASATDECIIWPFATGNGYGQLGMNGRVWLAHRVVLERTAGPPPDPTMQAAHAPLICHNRACVNPRHLRWATRKQNSDDKLIDGYTNRGERNGCAKLTAAQVLAIYRDSRPAVTLAGEHGVSAAAVRAIRTGRRWGWLTHTSGGVSQ